MLCMNIRMIICADIYVMSISQFEDAKSVNPANAPAQLGCVAFLYNASSLINIVK